MIWKERTLTPFSRYKVPAILSMLMVAWLILGQSCMRFRMSEKEANSFFANHHTKAEDLNVQLTNQNLHYVKIGSDSLPTLLFIHGSPGSWEAFKDYLVDSSLTQRFRMIAIDRPGFGYSDFGNALHLAPQAARIEAIVQKEHNNLPLHLVGHSIGGPVIVQLAQNHPNWYSSLTILAGSISPQHEPKEYWRYPLVYFPLKFLLPGAFRPSNREIVFFKKDLEVLDKGYDSLTMPITFIHGNKDKFVPVDNVNYGVNKLKNNPDVTVILIPGADHFIPWSHKSKIITHLLSL